MRARILLVAGFAIAGCAAATHDQLVRRASFDLACAGDHLSVVELDNQTQGVLGCGKRATYIETCDGPRNAASTRCTWALNGAIRASTDPAKP